MKFKLFPLKQNQAKSNSTSNCAPLFRSQSFIDYLLGKNETKLAAYQAVKYFDLCAPLFDAVDRISYAFSIINPVVYDEQNKVFLDNHPVIDLLKKPNINTSGSDFMYSLVAFLILTGNSYMIGSGMNPSKPPSQLFINPPQNVAIEQGGNGQVMAYSVTAGNILKQYVLTPDLANGINTYISTNGGITSELFHFKTFNSMANGFGIMGSSILNAIYFEIEQYISSGKHNLSLLKRGTTLSGVFKADGMIDDKQMENLRAQINEYFSGDGNAGRPFVTNNLDFTPSQQSNKDMDFMELKKSVEETIYKNLRIPLPLVSADTMIMANLTTSTTLFYDDGVIPWVERIYDSLTRFLMPKYPDSENLKIWFNIKDIPALESRKIDNLKSLQSTNLFTTNQLRNDYGTYGMIDGDSIYLPSNLVPTIRDQEDEIGGSDNDDSSSNNNIVDDSDTDD